jgi:uncharacterized membrane protein YoaK (UPF0700 family)
VVANSVVALGLGLYGSFAEAATLSVVTRLGIFALTCAALPVLRRRHEAKAPFHVPGGAAFAALGVVFCLGLLATRRFDQLWWLLLILAGGFLLRGLVGRAGDKGATRD